MILCRKKEYTIACSQIYIWCPQGSTANPGAPAYPSPGKGAQRASGWVGSNGAWEPPEISDDDFNQSFIFLLQIFMPAVHCC